MSGEFGDNVSISSRRKSVVIAGDDNVIISRNRERIHTLSIFRLFKIIYKIIISKNYDIVAIFI